MTSSKYISQWRRRKSRKGEEKSGKRGKGKERKARRVGMRWEKEEKEKKENYEFSLILWFSSHENVTPKVSRMWYYEQIQGSLM